MSPEGAEKCYCEKIIGNPWMIMVTRRSAWRWEERKRQSIFKKGWKEPQCWWWCNNLSRKKIRLNQISETVRRTKHGSTEGKSCLTSLLIPFYNEITSLIGEKRALDIVCLVFHKAFDICPHKILLADEVETGWASSKVGWKMSEWLVHAEGGVQWHKLYLAGGQ